MADDNPILEALDAFEDGFDEARQMRLEARSETANDALVSAVLALGVQLDAGARLLLAVARDEETNHAAN